VVAGAYPVLTWVKVAVFYLLSFLGASLRVAVSVPEGVQELPLRVPFLVVSLVVGWLLWRAGSRCRRWSGVPVATLVFAAPIVFAASVTELRFPDRGISVVPQMWQAAAVPFAFAFVLVAAGRVSRVREHVLVGGRWNGRIVAAAQGGWRMFGVAMWLALAGVLVLAAFKSSTTTSYVRGLVDQGAPGALVLGHHALLLGNQSVFVLDIAAGGEVRVRAGDGAGSALTLDEVRFGTDGPLAAVAGVPAVPLGGGFYAAFLIPAVATVLGGRAAGSGWRSGWERAGRGAMAGLVFGGLLTTVALFSAIVLPVILPIGLLPGVETLVIEPALVPTVVSAFAWGLLGGTLGGLSSPFVRG